MPPMSVQLVICSCPDRQCAEGMAQSLVQEQLAACVSVLPGVRSIYRWEGRIEQADEVLLLAKTTAGGVPALVERLQALHPYELPEILAVETAGGLPAYLAWVAAQIHEVE
ncbi:divalent-cation tolerance protein CutA [Pseudoxanthomonas koreensis]|uniref:divalent-cation tolerance protein CutA n=1 Tax=Pseudoxanthomonas koreensis TaxID=266061 RepID=UPI0035A625D9